MAATEISTQTLDDEFDRKKRYTNTCGFDDATLRRRELEMRELIKAYPNMPESWLELCWNYTEFTPKEEQDNIIKNKLWEGKPTNRRSTGGVIKNAMSIMTRDEYELSKGDPTDSSGN
tara:strand:- start:1016 stop:1369 length:354 start_codon:yes stop_codon:yes gene_type:complete